MQQVRFGPIDVEYDDEVLEPRPWTIEQSRWGPALLDGLPGGPVLELCAGAGQIGLVAAVESGRELVQVDADEGACVHARRNAARAGVTSDVRCGGLVLLQLGSTDQADALGATADQHDLAVVETRVAGTTGPDAPPASRVGAGA